MMEDFTCAFGTSDGYRPTDRQTAALYRLGVKNEKIQIYGPTQGILVIITFSSTECLSKSAQMSRLARA